MELLMMLIVIIILLTLLYYFNKNFECFTSNSIDTKKEIKEIKKNYDKLIEEKNNDKKEDLKYKIELSIKKIEKTLVNNYDKYKLNNLYNTELIPLLNNPNINKFIIIINKIQFLIDYSLNSNYYEYSNIINEIKVEFKNLNSLYESIYINKTVKFNKNKIDSISKKIYDLLLKITTHNDLNSSGIILILNTSLKRAYETSDLIQINSLISTFDEKIKSLNYNKVIYSSNYNDSYELNLPTTTISVHKDKEIITLIQEDFDNIYNSFDLINIIYKNNGDKKQLKELNNIIFNSIDNIISYNKNDNDYKNKIMSVRNVIITPILSKELKESYNKNYNEIIKIKNKFYDAIIEIKNIIISNYSKTHSDDNRSNCLKSIINAILNNNYPIEIKKLNGCTNSIFLDNNDLTIYPQIAVSKNNGKTWDFATDLNEFKKNNKKKGEYLYTYKLASNDGTKWSFIN